MSKKIKFLNYVTAISLLGIIVNETEDIMTKHPHLEEKISCSFGAIPTIKDYQETEKRYHQDEIRKLFHEAYYCLPNKPDYFSEGLIKAIVHTESSFNNRAVGKNGERGLMQIMKDTWEDQTLRLYGKKLPFSLAFNPKLNLEVGTSYLIWIHNFSKDKYPGWENLDKNEKRRILVASYNGGAPRLHKKGGDIYQMPKITQKYIELIESRVDD